MHPLRFTERSWLSSGFPPIVCQQTLVTPSNRLCAINDGRGPLICIKCVAMHICILRSGNSLPDETAKQQWLKMNRGRP